VHGFHLAIKLYFWGENQWASSFQYYYQSSKQNLAAPVSQAFLATTNGILVISLGSKGFGTIYSSPNEICFRPVAEKTSWGTGSYAN